MSAAFAAVFAVFLLLLLGLVVVAVRWGVRRDRALRQERTRHAGSDDEQAERG